MEYEKVDFKGIELLLSEIEKIYKDVPETIIDKAFRPGLLFLAIFGAIVGGESF